MGNRNLFFTVNSLFAFLVLFSLASWLCLSCHFIPWDANADNAAFRPTDTPRTRNTFISELNTDATDAPLADEAYFAIPLCVHHSAGPQHALVGDLRVQDESSGDAQFLNRQAPDSRRAWQSRPKAPSCAYRAHCGKSTNSRIILNTLGRQENPVGGVPCDSENSRNGQGRMNHDFRNVADSVRRLGESLQTGTGGVPSGNAGGDPPERPRDQHGAHDGGPMFPYWTLIIFILIIFHLFAISRGLLVAMEARFRDV